MNHLDIPMPKVNFDRVLDRIGTIGLLKRARECIELRNQRYICHAVNAMGRLYATHIARDLTHAIDQALYPSIAYDAWVARTLGNNRFRKLTDDEDYELFRKYRLLWIDQMIARLESQYDGGNDATD